MAKRRRKGSKKRKGGKGLAGDLTKAINAIRRAKSHIKK